MNNKFFQKIISIVIAILMMSAVLSGCSNLRETSDTVIVTTKEDDNQLISLRRLLQLLGIEKNFKELKDLELESMEFTLEDGRSVEIVNNNANYHFIIRGKDNKLSIDWNTEENSIVVALSDDSGELVLSAEESQPKAATVAVYIEDNTETKKLNLSQASTVVEAMIDGSIQNILAEDIIKRNLDGFITNENSVDLNFPDVEEIKNAFGININIEEETEKAIEQEIVLLTKGNKEADKKEIEQTAKENIIDRLANHGLNIDSTESEHIFIEVESNDNSSREQYVLRRKNQKNGITVIHEIKNIAEYVHDKQHEEESIKVLLYVANQNILLEIKKVDNKSITAKLSSYGEKESSKYLNIKNDEQFKSVITAMYDAFELDKPLNNFISDQFGGFGEAQKVKEKVPKE